MTNQEKEHYLSVLVELQLFNITRAIKESNIDDKSVQREKAITKFIRELPPYLYELPDVENKVRSILIRTEKSNEKIERLRQEHNRELDREDER